MAQFSIPRTNLPLGPDTFGPFSVGSSVEADIAVNRNITGGLNSVPATTTVDVLVQSSTDGAAWFDEIEMTWQGGITSDRNGQRNSESLTVRGLDPSRTAVHLVLTTAGSRVFISGTVTVI